MTLHRAASYRLQALHWTLNCRSYLILWYTFKYTPYGDISYGRLVFEQLPFSHLSSQDDSNANTTIRRLETITHMFYFSSQCPHSRIGTLYIISLHPERLPFERRIVAIFTELAVAVVSPIFTCFTRFSLFERSVFVRHESAFKTHTHTYKHTHGENEHDDKNRTVEEILMASNGDHAYFSLRPSTTWWFEIRFVDCVKMWFEWSNLTLAVSIVLWCDCGSKNCNSWIELRK